MIIGVYHAIIKIDFGTKEFMKVAVVDDQIEFRSQIKDIILKKYNDFEIQEYSSGEEILSDDFGQFSLFFLDIEMNDINGLATAKKIKQKNRNAVIFFVTSYTSYITEALRTVPFQYIVKPINEKIFTAELIRAVEKIKRLFDKIEVSRYGIKTIIKIDEIMYVEYSYRIVSFVMCDGKRFECSNSFKQITEKLAVYEIRQCHNSFLISLRYVKKITPGGSIVFLDNTEIPVSKKYIKTIREKHREFISGVAI